MCYFFWDNISVWVRTSLKTMVIHGRMWYIGEHVCFFFHLLTAYWRFGNRYYYIVTIVVETDAPMLLLLVSVQRLRRQT